MFYNNGIASLLISTICIKSNLEEIVNLSIRVYTCFFLFNTSLNFKELMIKSTNNILIRRILFNETLHTKFYFVSVSTFTFLFEMVRP
jgi:hypothetical protein